MLKAQIRKKRREMEINVAIELDRGAALGLFGASGAGKSTVLACIAGIEAPDSGSVELAGTRLYPPSLALHRRPIGYLTQEPALFPHLSVAENVCFGVPRQAAFSVEQRLWIETLRDRLQLAPLWQAGAASISGGQARRVALARMLARKPKLVLLDEPFAGLDRQLVRELIDDLVSWSAMLGFSMIAVDHQAEVLRRLCPQRIAVIENGTIVQSGSWEQVHAAPATGLLQSLLAPL